jgi:hypothetical protein
MRSLNPQLLYTILVLPSLLGLALLGEGINRIVHEKNDGIIWTIFGLFFVGVVIFAYLFVHT